MTTRTKSIIRMTKVLNTDRVFGAQQNYIPALIDYGTGGSLAPALFTEDQIREAVARADKNPEDAPRRTWWQQFRIDFRLK